MELSERFCNASLLKRGGSILCSSIVDCDMPRQPTSGLLVCGREPPVGEASVAEVLGEVKVSIVK